MSTFLLRLVSLLLFAALCVVSTYWFIVLSGRGQVATEAAAPAAPLTTDAAGQLFGGSPTLATRQDFKVIGILSLGPGHGAAAIIASSDGPVHTLAAGQQIDAQTRVSEVRAHSVVLERAGVKTELFLPAASQASGYLR